MKKSLAILMFIAFFSSAKGQYFTNDYIETNIGVTQLYDELNGTFPGASVLYGYKTFFDNNLVLDTQFGLAFPSALTGKIGIGYHDKSSNSIVTIGVRPWPAHAYGQIEFWDRQKRGSWTISLEPSAYTLFGDNFEDASMYSEGLITVGYRFHWKQN